MQQALGQDERYYFNDARGILGVYEEAWEEPQVYLDLRDRGVGFSNAAYPNEAGFLGFAFHPQFMQEGEPGYGKLYTAFSASPGSGVADYIESDESAQESVLIEWQVEDLTSAQFVGTHREMLRIGQFAANHNIGSIAFNPTASFGDPDFGMLYITLGDGGGAHDPANHGQNPDSVLGTILRIDPFGGVEGESEYGIPSDNPFAESGGLAEVWAYGVRHPQHLSWDSMDGQMYFIDIGQDQIEEVNRGVSGGNYGWRLREGTFATAHGVDTDDEPTNVYERGEDSSSLIYPVAQYDHDEGFAISSGFVYRGEGIPELQGMFVFTELVRGRVFYMDTSSLEPESATTIHELEVVIGDDAELLLDVAGYTNFNGSHRPHDLRLDLRLSVDLDGELYIATMGDGWFRKLATR